MAFKLYHYWRSSCSWRVRMALALKGVSCEFVAVDLLTDAQSSPEHLARNPSGSVPCLELTESGSTRFLHQSVAIIEFLEETIPTPALLPQDPWQRAKVRELVQIIGADTQPVQNLRVMKHHSPDQTERAHWAKYWIEIGLTAYETACKSVAGTFSFGDTVTMADIFLVPQVYNAGRFGVDLANFPTLKRVHDTVTRQAFCQESAPDRFQP